ncbi:hypothetical protein H5410_036144 [Solanum commersonii]|uniref:indole-3-pyruvate monooxygenase n=1 Tax=Solanum commersonii TaxID=4109 RepID=A0A9J5Y5M6_SOLCO|nr:hypothetical protein H5410_036144 [Solanum commersonii]
MANFTKEEIDIIVVGVGPFGIAVSACFNKLSINNVVLEKQDCCAYLWKEKTYDRLHLHLLKDFCSLPFITHATSSPNGEKKWNVKSRNLTSEEIEMYTSDFLILVTRESNEGYIPKMIGIEYFKGGKIHSSDYRSGEKYKDKKDYSSIFLEDGTLIKLKRENGLHCTGFSKRGIVGNSIDARAFDSKTIRGDKI